MTLYSYSLPTVSDPDDLVWVFDLDNTLYSPVYNLFSQIERNIQQYIERLLHVSPDEARRIRKNYFFSYGTTLRGLMEEHRINPDDYLDHVHVIDLAGLPSDPHLIAGLQALPGRKVIFTNGSLKHARNIVRHLEIEHFFDGIFDIAASCYVPKPEMAPYRAMLDCFAIDPARAVMIEDIPRNLEPAARLGMTTLLVTGNDFVHPDERKAEYIHQMTDSLGFWLRGAADCLASP